MKAALVCNEFWHSQLKISLHTEKNRVITAQNLQSIDSEPFSLLN